MTAWRTRRSPHLGPFGMRVLFLAAGGTVGAEHRRPAAHEVPAWLGFATESNNVMDYFFRSGAVPAVAFKMGIVTVGTLLLWRLRRYRTALFAAALLTGVFAAVVAYQALWVLSL